MPTPSPKPTTGSSAAMAAAKKVAAAKAAKNKKRQSEIDAMKKNPANYTMKGQYGFDGMQGQTGPEAKLKGK